MNTTLVTRPIFIVGAGRSGTTLLRSLLSAHSRISVAPETHFMRRAVDEGGLGRGAPTDFDAFWNRYISSVRFKDLGVNASRCLELVDQQGEQSFRSVFRAVLTAYGERVGKDRIGEKTPGHVHFLSQLLEWFPEARILVLQRDPRAVVASQLRTPWVEGRLASASLRYGLLVRKRLYYIAYYAEDWVRIYQSVVPAWREDSRMLIVSYETLVDDPESEARRICRHLGEHYEPEMLHNRTDTTVPMPAGTMGKSGWEEWRKEHAAQTLRPISSDSLTKWEKQLSGAEIAMIEGRCIRGMRAAGYALSTPPLQRWLGEAFSRVVHVSGNSETRVRARAKRITHPLRSLAGSGRRSG